MVDIGADSAVYEHIIEPDEPEAIVEIELEPEVDEDISTCSMPACTEVIGDHAVECDDCHQEFCPTHTAACNWCDDPVCDACAQTYYSTDGIYCHYCFDNMADCCVCTTAINTESDSSKYCDSHDAYCCSSCYGGDDKCEDCYQSDGTHAEMGSRQQAPWETRDVHTPNSIYAEAQTLEFNSTDALALWGVDKSLSLNEGAADFYLLETVQRNLDCGELAEPMLVVMAEEARLARANLVATYDPTFCGYADMAIGGELRYHIAVGNNRHLPGNRTEAWKHWRILRARGGTDVLLDAAGLFDEMGGGGVGGAKWAAAARLLHSRLTNRITPEQWVDRVFTLQHNGGAFTNKITWGPGGFESGQDICNLIGPAHANHPTDYVTLLKYASRSGRGLFYDWWPVANRNRMRWRRTPWRMPSAHDFQMLRDRFIWFRAFVHAGWKGAEGRAQAIEAWKDDEYRAAMRFTPYFISARFAHEYGVHFSWPEAPGAMCRSVVNRTLDQGHGAFPFPTFPMLHVHAGSFLTWLCDLIATHPNELSQRAMFEELMVKGVQIPRAHHAAAGLALL